MQNFKDYLLTEKIEKREFAKIFTDDTIRVGMEFECYINGLQRMSGLVDAAESYTQVRWNAEQMVADMLSIRKEWRIGNNDAKEAKLYDLGQARDVAETEEERDELYDQMERLKELDPYDIEELNNEFDLDLQNEYEYVEQNMDQHDLSVGYELAEMWDVRPEEAEDRIRAAAWDLGMENSDEEDISDALNNMDFFHVSEEMGDETTLEDLEEFDWDSIVPFNNYKIGDYHDGVEFHKWRIELDSSTGENGVEIISPIMKIVDALPMMDQMFEMIQKHGGTTKEHGFHVNISRKGAGTETVDLLKLMLFVDEGYVWKHFPDRKDNHYTKSAIDMVRAAMTNKSAEIQGDINKIQRDVNDKSQKLFSNFKAKLKLPPEKFMSINFSNLQTGSGRIEMRQLGGKDYHRKNKEVKMAIGRYAYYLLLSLDPEFKKDEYMKKLFVMSNKTGGDGPSQDIIRKKGKVVGESEWENHYLYKGTIYSIGKTTGQMSGRKGREWMKYMKKLKNYNAI